MIELALDLAKLLAACGVGGLATALVTRRRTAAETRKIEAETSKIRTDEKHIHFDELVEMISILSQRVTIAEKKLDACEKREAGHKLRLEEIEQRQRVMARMLRTAWPLDHSIPEDMLALIDQIDRSISNAQKPVRRRTRKKAA